MQNHQHLQKLAQELTRFFTRPFSRELTRDFACRLVCKILDASSVSILIYSSLKDKLVCKGRYINHEQLDVRPNLALHVVLRNIQLCEFIHEHIEECKEDIQSEYQNFCNYFEDECIPYSVFQQHFESYGFWKKDYIKLKKTYRSETYEIGTTTISGNYYKNLLDGKQEHEIYLADFQEEPIHKRLAETILKDELGINAIGFKYYVAIPLRVSNRYFGLMRFIFNTDKGICKNEEGQLKMKNTIQERIEYIVQSIALQSDNYYYYNGFRSFNFQTLINLLILKMI